MTNILVIGNPESHAALRFQEEVDMRDDISMTIASMHEVSFVVSAHEQHAVLHEENILETFDVVCFRWMYPLVSPALHLAELLHEKGIRVINSEFGKTNHIHNKLYDYWKLAEKKISIPETRYCGTTEEAEAFLTTASYPLIAKAIHGTGGNHVHKVLSCDDALALREQYDREFVMYQQWIPITEEFRVLTLGDDVLGATKRTPTNGDFRANAALGGTAEEAVLTKDLADLALAAAKTLGQEFSGVDIAVADGKPYILEVNTSPGFSAFEDATDINVAKAFLEHLSA